MKKYTSIISLALVFALVGTGNAQSKFSSSKGSSKGSSQKTTDMSSIIDCLSQVRLSQNDNTIVKKAASGKKLSKKDQNRLADLAAENCGKSDKSSKSSKSSKGLSSGRKASGATSASDGKDARAKKGSKGKSVSSGS